MTPPALRTLLPAHGAIARPSVAVAVVVLARVVLAGIVVDGHTHFLAVMGAAAGRARSELVLMVSKVANTRRQRRQPRQYHWQPHPTHLSSY